MKNKIVKTLCLVLVVGFLSLALTSCDLLLGLLGGDGGEDSAFSPTTEQMAFALKEALITGSTDAGNELSQEGAFYNNLSRRIPLPPEVDASINSLNTLPSIPSVNIPGVNLPTVPSAKTIFDKIAGSKLDSLVKSINESAEDASKGVAAAFAASITSMTFQDALIILKGEKGTEATEYLEATTRVPLKAAFKLVLDPALDADLFYDIFTKQYISANKLWADVITEYNNFAGTYNPAVDLYYSISSILIPNKISLKKIDLINTDLGDFVLEKALTAVFKEMADVEKRIRTDPLGFLSDVLGALTDAAAKVFDWAKQFIPSF